MVAEWLTENMPPTWSERTLPPMAMYSYVFFKVNAPKQSAVIVKPYKIEWIRKDRGTARRLHLIDIMIFGGSKKPENVTAVMDGLETIGNALMQMPFDVADVYGVETLADNPAGYDQIALEETATPLIGGLRISITV